MQNSDQGINNKDGLFNRTNVYTYETRPIFISGHSCLSIKSILNLVSTFTTREEPASPHPKLKALELKKFIGIRSVKEVDNFLSDLEQYFTQAMVKMVEKVYMASMYLIDAKLWRRSCLEDDAEAGCPKIEAWEVL